ncbi:MAG: iron-sulfur cluster-binding protein [Bacteroidales bacterium]|nr:iron-sulfur cluster-binding protein [Bacteroidales bacterium]
MHIKEKIFKKESEKVAFDIKHRNIIKFNISKYNNAVKTGKSYFKNLDLAKEKVSETKNKIIKNLDEYLIEFERNFKNNNGKVIWAKDSDEAIKEIISILLKKSAKLVVKGKSMMTEEIELNKWIEKENIEVIETDLGEYIVQIAGEKPYHIVTPAMHKSKEDIFELFNEKFKTPINTTPEFITDYVRKLLREKFVNADVGITGANFLIADIGGVAITENEGNGLMSTSFPKTHIVVAGIEKIIPSYKDLSIIWPTLAAHGTGQRMTVYNTIFTGPKKNNEIDGPEEMYVILIDNGRTNLLAQKEQKQALKCIKCGACLNACPVYRNIGGYTYDSTYGGPIGSVITPFLKGINEYKHLSYASSLCGKCTEVCPSKIDLHKLLIYNRRDFVEKKINPLTERITMFLYKSVFLNRFLLDIGNKRIRNFFAEKFGKKAWGPRRKLPVLQKSFSKQWKNKYN